MAGALKVHLAKLQLLEVKVDSILWLKPRSPHLLPSSQLLLLLVVDCKFLSLISLALTVQVVELEVYLIKALSNLVKLWVHSVRASPHLVAQKRHFSKDLNNLE